MLRSLHDKILELESRVHEVEESTNHHEQSHHVKLSESLWAILDENGSVTAYRSFEEEYISGSGI
jgi:hypothetical protein